MERVMKILPDMIALMAGGLLAIVICELAQRLVRFKRFATAWILMFVPFGLLLPSVLRVMIFPYTGAMSGMSYIATAVATFVAMIFLCRHVLLDCGGGYASTKAIHLLPDRLLHSGYYVPVLHCQRCQRPHYWVITLPMGVRKCRLSSPKLRLKTPQSRRLFR